MARESSPPKKVEELLAEPLQPERLPACYGVVIIAPYDTTPLPRAQYWKMDGPTGALVSAKHQACPQE